MNRISLAFSQIICVSCQQPRIRGVTCPHCGSQPDPREVDPDRKHRQRVVEEATALLDAPVIRGQPLGSPAEALDQLAEWPDRFFRWLSAMASGEHDGEQLEGAIRDLVALRSALGSVQRRRPWIVTWRAIDEVMDRLTESARLFLASVGADVPLVAQRLAAKAQEKLDAAGLPASVAAERLARWSRVGDAGSPNDALGVLVGEAYDLTSSENILALDSAGAALFRDVTGVEEVPLGIGVGMRLTDLQVEAVLDPDRFWTMVGAVSRSLIAHRDRLQELVATDGWIDDMRDATRRALDATEAALVLLAAARKSRHEIAATIGLLHELTEGPIRRYLSMLVAVTSGGGYARQRASDLGTLVQRAKQAGFHDVTDALDLALRGAKAHEEFRLDGDQVVLGTGARQKILSIEDLDDRALATIEVHLGLATGIICAAGAVGTDLGFLDPLYGLELEPSELVRLIGELAGLSDVEVGAVAPRLSLTASAPRPVGSDLVAMLVRYLPEETESGEIRLDLPTGRSRLSGPFAPVRRWCLERDGLPKEIAFVESRARWITDEDPWMPQTEVRKWIALKSAMTVGLPLGDAIATLRELRGLATALGDTEMVEALTATMSVLRSKAVDLPVDPGLSSEMERLARWMKP